MHQGVKLDLADGRRLTFHAVDEKAGQILAELARAMQLQPGRGGREFYVAVDRENSCDDEVVAETGIIIPCFHDNVDDATKISGMLRISSRVARESPRYGGLLLHCALAEYQGNGFILAGPSGVGKSTASHRLPPPWRSLCDDRTLVVRDKEGRYWAHPWPTWSRFYYDGPGGTWPVEQAVPLRAAFFLVQSASDRAEPIDSLTQATALILDSTVDLNHKLARLTRSGPTQRALGCRLLEDGVAVARAMAAVVPAFSLQVSLDGSYWDEIAKVLPVGEPVVGQAVVSRNSSGKGGQENMNCDFNPAGESHPADTSRIVYVGPSMNPTLREPDILEVKPYTSGRIKPGDVVCFRSSSGSTVVHRVVSVGISLPGANRPKTGIRTRGDNNPHDDEMLLTAEDIIGRVVSAFRGSRRRSLAGGWAGLMVARKVRLAKVIRRYVLFLPHVLYRFLSGLGPFGHLLPAGLRPKLVRFDTRNVVLLKLLIGRRTVGRYDERNRRWHIQRPFRLFIDEQKLPITDNVPVGK